MTQPVLAINPAALVYPVTDTPRTAGFNESVAASAPLQPYSLASARNPLAKAVEQALSAAVAGEPFCLLPGTLFEVWGESFTLEEIHQLVVAKRTLARRVAGNEPLSAEETDRAIRLARLRLQTDRVFGEPVRAGKWLRSPVPSLNGQRPVDLLVSEAGTQAVEQVLGRIDHGMFD